ncbi:Eco57I restriction-modification methylase domain-containing protein [Halorubrum lipolyticum]
MQEFDRTLLEFILSVSRFNYKNIRGDPLGELYQKHFTQETRRALGEFYTPPTLAEYVLDSAGYDPLESDRDLRQQRLIDPSCGSGTFLIQALEKYREQCGEDTNWATELRNLCERSRLVGLDIHPFAVVLAQIRFMLDILPEYGEAVEQEGPGFVLKRLPIYRTDSLIDESQVEEGLQRTLTASHDEGMIEFKMPLPIRQGSDFESLPFELPEFSHVQEETLHEIQNQQQYFSALLGVFDAVKEIGGRQERYEVEQDELESYFTDYFEPHINTEQIANVFLDTANGFLGTVEELRHDYNDGRLLKLIEDVVLASVVKNDISHDYVVGNPPWVAKQNRYTGDDQNRRMQQLYYSAWGESDPYMEFIERGLDMLHTGGKLGFVVSNRFLYNSGAKEVRALLAKNEIKEIIDFTDVPIFPEATNYTATVTVEKEVENDDWSSFVEDGSFTSDYTITGTRVRQWDVTNDSDVIDIPALVETIRSRDPHPTIEFFDVDSSVFQERVWVSRGEVYREENSTRYTANGQRVTVSNQLPIADTWPFCPDTEQQLLDKVEERMDLRLGDRRVIRENKLEDAPNLVGDDIRVGIQTSGDSAYIVHPTIGISKEKFAEIDTLPITPREIDETYTVETDLLKIDISSEDVDRWLPSWDNRLVFVPYKQGDERAELIRPKELHDEYNLTWEYFTEPIVLETLSNDSVEREEIHNRLAFELGVIEEDEVIDDNGNENFRLPDLSTSQYQELSNELRANVDWLDRHDEGGIGTCIGRISRYYHAQKSSLVILYSGINCALMRRE